MATRVAASGGDGEGEVVASGPSVCVAASPHCGGVDCAAASAYVRAWAVSLLLNTHYVHIWVRVGLWYAGRKVRAGFKGEPSSSDFQTLRERHRPYGQEMQEINDNCAPVGNTRPQTMTGLKWKF